MEVCFTIKRGEDRMEFLDVMHAYFRGEKLEALWFILPTGLLLIGFAGVALRAERPAFAWGVAVPCILFGLVAVGTGATVGARTSSQVAQLEAKRVTDPESMVNEELARMRRVNESFRLYVMAYVVLTLLGLALRFLLRADWAHGAGAALLLVAALGMMIDGFAERRARPYTAVLERLVAERR
jgi:hypothetical protein